MNHLRELIETIERGELEIVEEISEKDFPTARLIPAIKMGLEEAVCFSGDLTGVVGLKPIKELCGRLPFRSCYFEFDCTAAASQTLHLGILAQEMGEKLSLVCIRKLKESWLLLAVINSDGETVRGQCMGGGKVALDYFSFVRTYLTAMRCNNVQRTEIHPDEKLQKARAKRGKKPLFSYWTLELKQERTEGDPLGGTHASPRLHLRRGHPRQFAPGQWTWVQPCVVGNKAAGMVHKDYALA